MQRYDKTFNFTIIYHPIRIFFGLSNNEYCLADSIYRLSMNQTSYGKGWCFAHKKTLGKMLWCTEKNIFEMMNKLLKIGLIERHPETKFLRPAKLWHEAMEICEWPIEEKLDWLTNSLAKANKKLSRKHY